MAEPNAPLEGSPKDVHGWIKEAVQESDAFLREQPGYGKIEPTMKAIYGQAQELRSSDLSSTKSNRLAKVATDMASHLTDIKPFWEFRTFNKSYERSAEIYGKLSQQWYQQRMADMEMNQAVKYYLMAGASFTSLGWDSETQDLSMTAEDPRDVLPIRPSNYMSIQSGIGVIMRRERSVNYLKARYPREKWGLIKADRDGSKRADKGDSRFTKILEGLGVPSDSMFQRALFGRPMRETPKLPMADVNEVYLKDDTRNDTSHPILMGQWEDGKAQNNWSYMVLPGQKLYPRGRHIVTTTHGTLHDGPNPYWHGMFPCPKLNLDPWPQSWFGKAPLWDLLPLQKSLANALRGVDDHIAKLVEPDVVADKNSVPRSVLERWNTRKAGGKYQHNPIAGKGIELVYPRPILRDLQWWIEYLNSEMDTLSGNRDLAQLMQLNQVPGADTIEKITESMTASVQARSRALEAYMREFATMLAYNFAQFYNVGRRITILGAGGVVEDDFDFDPGSIVPAFIHQEDFADGRPTPTAIARGPRPRYDRAREFMRQFTFHIAPGSLLAASEIQRKLLYLQLSRAGLIDHWTLLEVLGIPNVGEPPDGATTITARLQMEQQMGLGMQVSATGRKATGQSMPRMTVKES
jgi:hypothetical protein